MLGRRDYLGTGAPRWLRRGNSLTTVTPLPAGASGSPLHTGGSFVMGLHLGSVDGEIVCRYRVLSCIFNWCAGSRKKCRGVDDVSWPSFGRFKQSFSQHHGRPFWQAVKSSYSRAIPRSRPFVAATGRAKHPLTGCNVGVEQPRVAPVCVEFASPWRVRHHKHI